MLITLWDIKPNSISIQYKDWISPQSIPRSAISYKSDQLVEEIMECPFKMELQIATWKWRQLDDNF